jgi:hypothetical protein
MEDTKGTIITVDGEDGGFYKACQQRLGKVRQPPTSSRQQLRVGALHFGDAVADERVPQHIAGPTTRIRSTSVYFREGRGPSKQRS